MSDKRLILNGGEVYEEYLPDDLASGVYFYMYIAKRNGSQDLFKKGKLGLAK